MIITLDRRFENDGFPKGQVSFENYHEEYGDENTGIQLDFSTGTLTFQTVNGTTTASNVRYIDGTTGDDTIIGSDVIVSYPSAPFMYWYWCIG